ncbi:unnamed protein product [Diamesa hyperborea]
MILTSLICILLFVLVILIIIYCTFFVALSSAQIAPYIINGRDALENEFPYIVSLRRTELELFAGYPYHICGGTIIDEVTVVTAAHCLFDMFKNGSYFVVAGIVSISSYTATSQMSIAEEIYKHPGYDPEVFSNDIAVLKVSPPFDFSFANVQPIKRAMANSTYVGQNCSVHGWGTLSYDLPIISDSLKTVDLEIYDHNLCNKTYEGLLSNDQICAYQLGKDSCSGDSGEYQ